MAKRKTNRRLDSSTCNRVKHAVAWCVKQCTFTYIKYIFLATSAVLLCLYLLLTLDFMTTGIDKAPIVIQNDIAKHSDGMNPPLRVERAPRGQYTESKQALPFDVRFQGEWRANRTYQVGDCMELGGVVYVALPFSDNNTRDDQEYVWRYLFD